MADGSTDDYRIRISTVADGTGAAQTESDLNEIQATAQRMGVSLEQAKLALDAIKKEDSASAFQKLKDDIRAANAEAASLTDQEAGVVDATKKVGQAAGEAGEGFNNALDNRRAVTHALHGLLELREGGVEALAGIASEGFVATEMFEGMLGPLAPILMTITLLASIGIPMFEKWSEKADKAADSEKDLGKASDDASQKRIDGIKRVVDAFSQMMAAEDANRSMLQDEAGYVQSEADSSEKLLEARKKLAVAELENQRATALGNAKSKDEVEQINERFKNLIAGTERSADADILNQKILASAENIGAKTQEQKGIGVDLKQNEEQLQAVRDAAAKAQQEAADAGVMPDQAGSYAQVRKDLAKQVDELGRASKAAPLNSDLLNQLHDAGLKLAAANEADSRTQGLQKWEDLLMPKIGELSKKFDDLGAAIDKAKADNEILQINYQTALKQANTAAQTEKNDAEAKDKKEAVEKQLADLDRQKTVAGADEENPTLSADDKAAIKAKVDEIEAQIAELRLQNSGVLGLSDEETIRLQGEVEADKKRVGFTVGQQQKKDEKASDTTGAREYLEKIEASHIPALVEQAKQIVLKDRGDMSQQLADLMALFVDHQTEINVGTAAALTKLTRKVESMRHTTHNN